MDDEERLVRILQIHARVSRSKLEVYFDKAPAGREGTRKVGMVTVHSISATSHRGYSHHRAGEIDEKRGKFLDGGQSDNRVKTECRGGWEPKWIESAEFSKMVQKSHE